MLLSSNDIKEYPGIPETNTLYSVMRLSFLLALCNNFNPVTSYHCNGTGQVYIGSGATGKKAVPFCTV